MNIFTIVKFVFDFLKPCLHILYLGVNCWVMLAVIKTNKEE